MKHCSLCQHYRRDQYGISKCEMHRCAFPFAHDCDRYAPPSPPPQNAESGVIWDGEYEGAV